MRWISVWETISVFLFFGGLSRTAPSSAPVVKLSAYHIVKKPIHTVSDKFLSFTADPNSISHIAECSSKDGNTTLNMAKSLTPAYFRIAGVDSNRLVFQSNPNSHPTDHISKSKIFPVTNSDWLKWNTFLSKTGMNVIACVSGETEPSSKSWDLSNILELITFSDKHNISLDWQLGYELQKIAPTQGKTMGRDVEKFRKILDVFPRYRESLIIGPDMTSFRTQNDAAFVRNYLTEAKDSLNVFTWHPFSKSSEDGEILEMLANGMVSMDNYLWIKDGLMKSSSKGVVPRKPIWIAESENTETVSNLSDSMTWIMRMGSAARLGASVYLRRPHLLSFYEPTPEYWTAILYKSLVGRTVLDIKQTAGNGTTKLQMFTHCTKFIEKPEESIINPEISYDPGSITVYGVNMASESTRVSFKIGYKADETAHLYVLTEDASGNFPKTLLNKQALDLSPENRLPIISPRVRESPKYLLIPARSIFFVVFPNTKCRSCNEYDILDASKVKIKVPEEEDPDTTISTTDLFDAAEDENDRDNIYVNFPKKEENSQIFADSSPSSENSNFKLTTKFVISSDDTWMNRFPQELKDVMKKEKDPLSDAKDKEKAQQYRLLAQAMTGKRPIQNTPVDSTKPENPASRFVFDEELSESMQTKRALKNSGRVGRSLESVSVNETESKLTVSQNVTRNDTQTKELINADDVEKYIEETSSGILKTPMEIDCRNIALYLYDQPDNDTNSNDTDKTQTLSAIYAVPLYGENFEEAMNSSEFKDTVPIITFVKKSTLEGIIEAAKDRVRRQTTMENVTISQVLSSSVNTLNKTSSSPNSITESATIEGAINGVVAEVAKLVEKFVDLSSISGTPKINRTQIYNRIFSQVLLNKNKSKNASQTENSTSGFDSEHDLESDKFQQALKDFERFKRWAESIPENELKSKQSCFDDNDEMVADKNIMKREEHPSNTNFVSSMNPNSQNMALYVFDNEDGEIRASETEKRSVLSKISAVPLDEESLRKAMEESEFRETIPILTFLPKSTLEGIVKAANERNKRETTLENSTSTQVFENSTDLSTTPPPSPSNSSAETTTQSITSESLLKEAKELSVDIADEVSRIMKQMIQNDTRNLLNSTQQPNLQQSNSSVSDLAKESDDSKIQRELREVDDDAGVDGNVLGSRKLKTIDKPNLRPVSPFPKKPKPAKTKSAKNKGKSSDNVQLNHQDASETESVLSSKRQTEEITSSSQHKSSNIAKTPKSADESEDGLLNYDSIAATKLHSEISENLREPSEMTKDPHKDISSKEEAPHSKKLHSEEPSQANLQESVDATKVPHKDISSTVGAPHSKKLHPEESSPVKQIPTEDDSSELGTQNPSNTPAMVGKPILRPATLADLEKERAKHHKALPQPIKKPKITPEQLRAAAEQKRKELLQRYSERLKEIRSILGLPAAHTHAKRNADLVEDTKEFFSHIWDGVQRWEPSKDWEASKSWIAKESKMLSDMVTKRDRRHIDENTTEQLSEQDSLDIFKNPRLRRNSEIVVSPHSVQKNPSTHEAFRNLKQASTEERRRLIEKKLDERKKAMMDRAKTAHSRHRRDTQENIEKLKQLIEERRISLNERHQKLAKKAKELKEKIAGRMAHRNKRDLQAIKDKLQELRQKKYQQRPKFSNKNDPHFPARRSEIPSNLAKNTKPIKHSLIRNRRDVQAVQNKIQELRQKKQERRNSLHKKTEVEHTPSNGNLEPSPSPAPLPTSNKKPEIENSPRNGNSDSSSNQTPAPTSRKKSEVKHAQHPTSETPLATNTSQSKVSKIDEPLHQVVNKTSKKLRKTPQVNKDKPPQRLSKRDANENQLEEKATSPADLKKNLHFHLFADPELNTPQSMLDDIKFDDLDRLKRSLNDNEIFDADDESGIKLKNKDPEGYHELKLNKMNDFVLEPITTTLKPSSIDVKISKGNSRFQTYEIKATASSQENKTCQLSYNVLKYVWCLTEKLWNTYIIKV